MTRDGDESISVAEPYLPLSVAARAGCRHLDLELLARRKQSTIRSSLSNCGAPRSSLAIGDEPETELAVDIVRVLLANGRAVSA